MRDYADLVAGLRRSEGAGYPSYRRFVGAWYGDFFDLEIERVQADPYAPPSAINATLTLAEAGIPAELVTDSDPHLTAARRLAAGDFLVRTFSQASRQEVRTPLGIAPTGQEILLRTAAEVTAETFTLRFQCSLPARGRRIRGHEAAHIFAQVIPDCLDRCCTPQLDLAALETHINTYLDFLHLQAELDRRGWIAFVADGAILARGSGISDRPLAASVPFTSPPELAAEVELPHAGKVTGMAITPGITVIVGGGYHGKSTLLRALERGVYPHIPGDGRELVVTTPTAMKIRAEDGRSVCAVDISPFVAQLPDGTDTTNFSTSNASGSTSQAAAIVEAISAGTRALLIDEDTAATNLMIRDERMRALVGADREPLTPLTERIIELYRDLGVSTILVMGGSGEYLALADHVLLLDTYRTSEVTKRARKVAAPPAGQVPQPETPAGFAWTNAPSRRPLPNSAGPRGRKARATGTQAVRLDREEIDLGALEQITDPGQTAAIALLLDRLLAGGPTGFDGQTDLSTCVARLLSPVATAPDLEEACSRQRRSAFLAQPRLVDAVGVINRYRSLRLARFDQPLSRGRK